MNSEKQSITILSSHLPRSPHQANPLFCSDSEIIHTKTGNLLYSVDEYSAEDHFREGDPYSLGWNLAVATISDIFASGGLPRYYLHAVSVNPKIWNSDYLEDFSKGLGQVMKNCGIYFLGGDFGYAEDWHYTGIAVGKSSRLLTREGSKPGDTLYMTGVAGAGNIEAAIQLFGLSGQFPPVCFALRNKEAKIIKNYASSCIDTSDGVVNSLLMLAEINHTGFSIHTMLYHPLAQKLMKITGLTGNLLLMGECGEYELLFTVPEKKTEEFEQLVKTRRLNILTIGKITGEETKTIKTTGGILNLEAFALKGRDFASESDYLKELMNYSKHHEIR